MINIVRGLVIFLTSIYTTSIFATETTIKKINKEKKTVVIKGTEADGFVKDHKVCFYNPVDSKKVACGTIRKNGKVTSLVSLAPKAILRIRKNFIVSTSQEKVLGIMVANQKNKDGLGGDVQVGQSTDTDAIVISPYRVQLSYLYSVLTPVIATLLQYDTILSGSTQGSKDSLWEDGGDINSSPFSIVASFIYHINRLFSVSLGLQYTFFIPTSVKSTHTYQSPQNRVDLEFKGEASILGINSDFTAYRYYLGPHHSNFYCSAGLAIEMFSLSTTIKDQVIVDGNQTEENTIAEIDAKLTAIGLRLGVGYEIYSKENLGFVFGLITTVPVIGSPSYSGSDNDKKVSYLKPGIDPTDDLHDALDVKKTIGFSVSLSSFIQF